MPLLKVGAKIPAFLLKDSAGKSFGSSDLKGHYSVIYFYPRDDTPGCTLEACEFRDLSKTFEKLEVKAIALSGKVYGAEHLDFVASLPTRDEALSKLMYVMKAPVEKFVRTLAEPYAKLVRTVAAVKDQKAAG